MIIFSFFLLMQVSLEEYSINQLDIGCFTSDSSTGKCTALCVLGVEDCSNPTPKCEYGYFLFTLGSSSSKKPECVQCPYQTVNEDLTKYCMDCVEDPYGWEFSRKCSYDYVVGNGIIGSGSYQKSIRKYPELFFVGPQILQVSWTGSPPRSTTYKYAVYICTGCQDFCTDTTSDSSCHEINSDYKEIDIDKIGVKCVDGYYFKNNLCQSCSVRYCLICDDDNTCKICEDGYRLSTDQKSCTKCTGNCATCHTNSESIQQCDSCDDGYIIGLDLTSCEACSDSCIRCEYVSFSTDTEVQYPTRSFTPIETAKQSKYTKICRQCEQAKDQIDLYGETCFPCFINNCQLCYYSIKNGNGVWRTTMDLDFTPWNSADDQDLKYLCFTCDEGYALSTDQLSCSANDPAKIKTNCALHTILSSGNYMCVYCSSGYILDSTNGNCYGTCSDYIENCLNCMSYNSADTPSYFDASGVKQTINSQQLYTCLKCEDGFYPDFFTGLCLQCLSNCDTCSQYNQNYNFTDYLQQHKIESQFTKSNYLTTELEEPYCSKCQDGYIKYGNTCQGCTNNCVSDNPSRTASDPSSFLIKQCTYMTNGAFCGQCYNSNQDRSLNLDESECHQCPEQCQACRDRTTSEIFRVNHYFSPSNSLLQKYSRICYIYNSNAESGKKVTYDTYLNMPTQCTYSDGKTKKCVKTAIINIKLYCDKTEYASALTSASSEEKKYIFDLNYFYSVSQTSTTNITFSTLETLTFYQKLSENSVSEATLKIQLIKSPENGVKTCSFTSNTNIIVEIQRNVFPIREMNVEIIGETDETLPPLLIRIDGVLKIPWSHNLFLKGIEIQQALEPIYSPFGIQITNNIRTRLQLYNFKIGREKKLLNESIPILFHLDNIYQIIWNKVKFYNFFDTDDFTITYTQDYISQINYQINDVTFYQSDFADRILFNPIQNSNVKSIYIYAGVDGITLEKCSLINSKVFGEYDSNTYSSGTSEFHKVVIKYTKFNNSKFIEMSSQNQTIISNLDLIRSNFTESSILIVSNSFSIQNVYADKNLIYSGCRLFQNSYKVIDDKWASQAIREFKFNNLKILNTICFSIVCLMKLETPLNNYGYQTNLTMEEIIIDSSDSFKILEKETNSILSALILIQNLQRIQIKDFQSLNNFGITSLAALDIESFSLNIGLYDWTQDQYDSQQQLLPCNNKIPTSADCASRKISYKSFNQNFIYIANYNIGVAIKNVALRRLLSIDTNFIIIKSWDVDQFNSTRDTPINELSAFYHQTNVELIILKNVNVIGNSLVITESRTQIASIFIESDQEQKITIEDCKFSENHLHSLSSDQLSPSSPIFVIQSPLSNLQLINCTFDNNRATRVHNSVIHIVSYNLTIFGCKFSNTNIRKKNWIYRLEEQQIVNTTSSADDTKEIIKQLELFFPIYSAGGNFYAKIGYLTIQQTSFLNSYAVSGAGIYIETIDEGIVLIQKTSFKNQYNTLLNEYASKGGCMFIDSSKSKIDLTLQNVQMQNCVTRQSGGCIYLSPSTLLSQVVIENSQFTECQALSESGISFTFSTSSPILPEVFISNCIFSENNIANFLRNIPDLTTVDYLFLYTTSTFYYQQYGRLSLDSVVFRKFSMISVFLLEYLAEVNINNVQIVNNTLFINSLTKIGLSQTQGTIAITASKFESNIQFIQQNTVPSSCSNYFVSNDNSKTLSAQICPIIEELDEKYRTDILPSKYISSSTDTYPLFDLTLDNAYKVLTADEKYIVTDPILDEPIEDCFINSINLDLNFEIFITYTEINNQAFLSCLYTILMNTYTSSASTFYTGLLLIESVTDKQYLSIESVTLQNNNCLRCLYGLFQVYKVHQTTTSPIKIIDFNCYSNIVGYYGCLILTHDYQIQEIEQSLPLTDYSLNGRLLGVVDDLLGEANSVVIKSCKFVKNKAKVGAGLTIFGLQSLIILSDFSDNYSSLMGGALYYQTATFQGSSTTILHLAANTVEGNTAQLAGGLFISGGAIGEVQSIQMYFQNNDGSLRGDNLEEYPSSLTLMMREGQLMKTETYESFSGDVENDGFIDSTTALIIDIIKLDSYKLYNYDNYTNYLLIPSGQAINSYNYYFSETNEQVPYEWKFRLINLDRFSQPMSNINSTESCKVTGRIMDTNNYNESKEFLSNFTTTSTYTYDAIDGVFNLDTLIVTFDPYSQPNLFLQLKFVCSSIKIPVYNTVSPFDIKGYNTNYALYVNIRTLPCQLGEAYTQEKCKACTKADKTYSVSIYDTQCFAMDSQTMDDVSPTNIKLKAGYWRFEFNSSEIEYCSNLPADCNGGWTPGNPSCYTGHMGALCESCDIYGIRDEPYAISAKYKCGQCADTTTVNAIVITALSIVTLVSMILSVKGNYQMLEDFVKTQNKMSMGILVSPSQSNLAILIKLFTNYFQILSAISTFQINLSSGITNATQVLGNPTQSMSYSLDCFLVSLSSVEILYFRLIWALVMPMIYLTTFLLGYILAIAMKKVDFKEGIIYTAFIYMFLYLQPTLVGGFIGLASSRAIGGLNWVQADVMYQYDTTEHYLWMAAFVAPLLIAWAFLFPCIFMFLVYKLRHKLNHFDSRKKLGYFYNEYTQEGYLWEFVKIFEKELVIIFLTFYEDRVVVKGLVIFVIVFIYGAFTVKFHPYQSNRLNFIDRLSTAICGASLCLGVLIYASILQDLVYLEIIMIIIVAIINFFFIILMVYYLFEGYLIKFQPQLDQIRDQLRIHHPEIQEKYPWSRKLLFNQKKMNERVKRLWATLRYETRKGINRKRKDHNAPLFQLDTQEQPVLTPFYIPESHQGKNQQKTAYHDSPNQQKVFPEQIHQVLNEEAYPLKEIKE